MNAQTLEEALKIVRNIEQVTGLEGWEVEPRCDEICLTHQQKEGRSELEISLVKHLRFGDQYSVRMTFRKEEISLLFHGTLKHSIKKAVQDMKTKMNGDSDHLPSFLSPFYKLAEE